MADIVDALLLLSDVRQHDDLCTHLLDMNKILVGVLDRLSLQIEQSQSEILIPDSFPSSQGYSPWIEEVWVNYLSNAIKYGGSPPHITFGGEYLSDNFARYWIKDNGPGLSQEDQTKLFLPFTRFNHLMPMGMVLGLSIVQRIIDKLGGTIGVDSPTGQGCTFYFTLPT